jgi:hypothetical protein
MRASGVWSIGCIALAACSPALVQEPGKIAQVQGLQCRQTTSTGSHMIRRVCTTQAEREAQSAQAQAGLEQAMEQQRNEVLVQRSERRQSGRP